MPKILSTHGMTREVIDDLSTLLPKEVVLHINHLLKTECKKTRSCSICGMKSHKRPSCEVERKVKMHPQLSEHYRFVKTCGAHSCHQCGKKSVPAFFFWQMQVEKEPQLVNCVPCLQEYFRTPQQRAWWEEVTREQLGGTWWYGN